MWLILYTCFVLNILCDFKYDIDKTYILHLFYSPARPLCRILSCLVLAVGTAAGEAEHAVEAVEPPVEGEWQPNDVM